MSGLVIRVALGLCLIAFCRGDVSRLLTMIADRDKKIATATSSAYGPSPGYTTSVFDSAPKDGVVSREEVMREFNCYDTDADGVISHCEWSNRQLLFWRQDMKSSSELFEMMDRDVDNHITPAEFMTMLDNADTIKRDGKITNSEFTACWEKMLRMARRMAGVPLPPVRYECPRKPDDCQLKFNVRQFLEDIDRNYDRQVQMVEGDAIADNAIFDLSTWIGLATTRYNLSGSAACAMYSLLDIDMSGDLSREDFANMALDTDSDGQVSVCEEWNHVSAVAKLAEEYSLVLSAQNKVLYKLLYGLDYVTPARERNCASTPDCLRRSPGVRSGASLMVGLDSTHQLIKQMASENPYYQKAQGARPSHSSCSSLPGNSTATLPSSFKQPGNNRTDGASQQHPGQQQPWGGSENGAELQNSTSPSVTETSTNATATTKVVGKGPGPGQTEEELDLSGLDVRGIFKIEG